MKVLKLATLACLTLPQFVYAKHAIVDGNHALQIGGQLATALNAGVVQNALTSYSEKKFNEVSVNTANIHVSGSIAEKFIYRLRLKFAPQETGDENVSASGAKTHSTYNMIDYAMAGYVFAPELTVLMGKVDVGGGFDFQSSAMSPLTFAQDADVFYGSGTANGIRAFGTFLETVDWAISAANSFDTNGTSKYEGSNDNRSMDYMLTVAHHSKEAADAEGYQAAGDFKHYVSFDYAQLDNSKTNHRNIYAATGFFSLRNAILHVAGTTETTKQRHDDFWTVGAGYLFDKTWRPGVTVSSVRSPTVTGDRGTHYIYAANVTMFHNDNTWRNYFEVSAIAKSDEAKKNVKAMGEKDVIPWKASVGITLNF